MRASITFDTLEYMDELKRSGMKQEEAEAITKATAKAFTQMLDTKEVAVKNDLKSLELAVKKDLNDTKLEMMKCISETMWKTIGILATFQTLIIGVFGILSYLIK
jgi:hypothetical protein